MKGLINKNATIFAVKQSNLLRRKNPHGLEGKAEASREYLLSYKEIYTPKKEGRMSRTFKLLVHTSSRESSLTSITRSAKIAATIRVAAISHQVLVGKSSLGSGEVVHDLHKAHPDVSGRTNAEVPGNKERLPRNALALEPVTSIQRMWTQVRTKSPLPRGHTLTHVRTPDDRSRLLSRI